MPSDDVILNLRQIAGYPDGGGVTDGDAILIQRGGLGGPYLSLDPVDFVVSAIGGASAVNLPGSLTAHGVSGGSLAFSNGVFGVVNVTDGAFGSLSASTILLNGEPVATLPQVSAMTVSSFNLRRGDVILDIGDIINAGGAPAWSPTLQGTPTAPTPDLADSSDRLATTAFVQRNIAGYIDYTLQNQDFVFTFNGRTGNVVLTAEDVINAGGTGEFFNNPTFTGDPQTPTPPPGDNDNSVASTAFVQNAIASSPLLTGFAPLNSPVFTGVPQGPTASPGSSSGQLATTAFVMAAVSSATAGVSTWNSRTGAVTMNSADITAAGGALLASPHFTGVPTAPTATPATNTDQLATTAFVAAALASVSGGVLSFNTRTGAVVLSTADITSAGGAPVNSPVFSGNPSGPTPAPNDSSASLATTAFVMSEIANGAVSSFNGRTGAVSFNSADLSAAGGASLNSPAFTGSPTAPTPAPGTNSTALATTAFVAAALATSGVTSFNSRTGAVTLTIGDVTGVGGAPLSSPAFSGAPTSPTPNVGDSSQRIATTAFVAAALAGGAGVQSFNGRTGVVVLTGADINAAGGALLSSPPFSGTPTAPTPAIGNNSTTLATTAFVQAAIVNNGVASFNGRNGSVTLNSADISAAGGAVLASPAFTGVPTAPTAAPATNTTQIATTAFVEAAVNAAGGVVSFNGRAGVVTLTGADLTGAGGALLASPAFTGSPTGTTATAGDNSTRLATTAFVTAAINAGAYLPLTGGTLTGNLTAPALTLTSTAGGGTPLYFTGPSASYRGMVGTTSGSLRWSMFLGDNTAESGSNSGSHFVLNRYSDAGAVLNQPIIIARNTGAITLTGAISLTGVVTVPTGNIAYLQGGFTCAGAVGAINNINSMNYAPTTGLVTENTNNPALYTNKLGGNGIVQSILQGGTACGSISVANGNATAFNTSSDVRLKDDAKGFDAGPFLDDIAVYDFRFRSGGPRRHGVMAQEVDEVYPEAVTYDERTDWWGVDYSKFVPLLLQEMKSLRQRVAQLEGPNGTKRGKK